MESLLNNLLWHNGFSYYRWKHSYHLNTSLKSFESVYSSCWSVWPLLISWLDARLHCLSSLITTYSRYRLLIPCHCGSFFHLPLGCDFSWKTLRPFRHQQLSLKTHWVAMATPWILSLSVGMSIFILTWFSLIMLQKVLIIVIICLTTPLLITCFSYLFIWRKRRKSTERRFRQKQKVRFSRTWFPL